MTVKRPARQTCASARPMNRTLPKVTFTGSAVRPQARQAPARKAPPCVLAPKEQGRDFRVQK